MRARVSILGGLGALATLGAVAVLLDPGLADALPGIGDLLESQDSERLLLGLGAVVATYAAWTARANSHESRPTDGPATRFARVGDPPEEATAAKRTRTGESFDARVEAACAGDDDALRAVRSALAETAASVASARERTGNRSSIEPRRTVETGTWTDDDLAAAFLAGEEGPNFSLAARIREWLDPEAERRRRVERTVEAVRQSVRDDRDPTNHRESQTNDPAAQTNDGESDSEEANR